MPNSLTLKIAKITDQGSVLVNLESIQKLHLGDTATVNLFVSPKTLQVELVGDVKVGHNEIWIPSHYNIGKVHGVARLSKLPEEKTNGDAGSWKSDTDMDWLVATIPNIRFADIAGLENVKEKIREAVIYPEKHPDVYAFYNVKPGGGFLLYGPPGTGKTMLAAAAAAESGATFIQLKGSTIKGKYVGESEKSVKEIFSFAKQQDKAIMFIDEIDGIVPYRNESTTSYEKSLIAEILEQIDGIESKQSRRNVLYIFASNRPQDVDSALLSRLPSGAIFVPLPDKASREHMLRGLLKGKPLEPDISVECLSAKIEGKSGRDIAAIVEVASMMPVKETIHNNKDMRPIRADDFHHAIENNKSTVGFWYEQTIKELGERTSEEREYFSALFETQEIYKGKLK